jgi:hypothetical protein
MMKTCRFRPQFRVSAAPLPVVAAVVTIFLFSPGRVQAQGFQVKDVNGHVLMVSHPDLGNQVVVRSARGLVVFDSFWSVNTARLFRAEMTKALHRDDFAYVIDMTDRLDMIGGNAAYPEAVVVGHDNIRAKYANDQTVREEREDLIQMWREKEAVSRNRLKTMEEGSEKARTERAWMNKCKAMADELESGFSLILPQLTYSDGMTLDLGDVTLRLRWFGETGNRRGLTMAVLPEEKLAILSKAIIFPAHHLAPYVQPDYRVLDVPRWIALLEEILEGDNAVDRVVLSDDNEILSRDLMYGHLTYIRKLWNSVTAAEAAGLGLQEIQDRLSLDKEFAFVKDMPVYKNNGDQWVRPQHELHTRLFYLQHKNNASEVIRKAGAGAVPASLDRIRKAPPGVYYLDEISLYGIGREWMQKGRVAAAIEIFKFGAESFPRSSWFFDGLGEAYMTIGDVEKAIAGYRRVLEIDPADGHAEAMLKKLEKRDRDG